MRRAVATLMVAITLVLISGSGDVSGQASCSFVRGFATLRDLVGAQKVGACLEDEHFNGENGNAEQQTAGGLLVWRKADNFTAFTDGGTTWVNGPNGLESRPNADRFSWERDPVTTTSARSSAPSSPAASSASPVPASSVQAVTAQGSAAQAGGGAAASAAAAQSTPTTTSTPTRPATSTATPTPAVTATPTPNPVQVKFRNKPDEVNTGNDARFEVETNAKKGTCTLFLTFRNTAEANYGGQEIDDGRCEWKFTLPADTRTGRATAQVSVTNEAGVTTKIDDTFQVRKGDTTLGGDIEIELDADDIPDRVSVGQEMEVSIDTSLKNRGSCDLSVTWPQVGSTTGERKTPSNNGRCSWKMPVPTTITKNGTATLSVTVTRNKSSVRTLTKEIDVRK